MYSFCDIHGTSSAETINGLRSRCKNHIRFLRGDNLVPFILTSALYINIKTLARKELNLSDLEDINLELFINSQFPCTCSDCARDTK